MTSSATAAAGAARSQLPLLVPFARQMYRAAQRRTPPSAGATTSTSPHTAITANRPSESSESSESSDPCCCSTSTHPLTDPSSPSNKARDSHLSSPVPHSSQTSAALDTKEPKEPTLACKAFTPCSSQVAHVQKVAFHLRDNPKHVLEVTASHIHTTTATPAPGTPHTHSHSSVDNLHVSVATQIGCKHNCSYCVSSMLGGLRRNLGLEELVAQIQYFTSPAAFDLPSDPLTAIPLSDSPPSRPASDPAPLTVRSVALHGHGEPLDNPDTLDFLAFLASPSYAHVFGASAPPPRTSVSTVGILSPLEELVSEFPSTAISWTLTSPFPDQRQLLMRSVESHSPMLKVLPLLQAARHSGHAAPIAMAYVLLDGVNDSDAHLEALARLAHSGPSALDAMPVSLIHFHPVLPVQDRKLAESIKAVGPESKVPSLAKFVPSAEQVVDRWVRELDRRGVPVSKQQYFEFPAGHL